MYVALGTTSDGVRGVDGLVGELARPETLAMEYREVMLPLNVELGACDSLEWLVGRVSA
jgi:hypothetical protein